MQFEFRNEDVRGLLSTWVYRGSDDADERLDVICRAVWSVVVNHDLLTKKEVAWQVGVTESELNRRLKNAAETIMDTWDDRSLIDARIYGNPHTNELLYMMASTVVLSGFGNFTEAKREPVALADARKYLSEFLHGTAIRTRRAYRGLMMAVDYLAHVLDNPADEPMPVKYLQGRFDKGSLAYRYSCIRVLMGCIMKDDECDGLRRLAKKYGLRENDSCGTILKAMAEDLRRADFSR